MNISVFLTIWLTGLNPGSAGLDEYFLGDQLSLLKANPDVAVVELYTPEISEERVHDMDEVPAPNLIVQIDMDSAESAIKLTESKAFKNLFTDKNGFPAPAEKINLEVVEALHYALPGQDKPSPRTASMSFVVRYYGPTRDGSDFAQYYKNHHPQIMSKFPGVRNTICYFPLDWKSMNKIDDERLIIGNEVVFDDLDSFKAALATDIFTELRLDGENFEDWGYSTHHSMHRQRVYARD